MTAAYLPLTEAQRDRANERLAGFAARGFVPDVAQIARGARLPDGLFEQGGNVMFTCRSCGQAAEWPADPEDYVDGDPHNVCGGSPRCCP